MATTIEQFQRVFPNAEPMWTGGENPDTATLEWNDSVIAVSPAWDVVGGYSVGFYPGDSWMESEGYFWTTEVATVAEALALVDRATEARGLEAMEAFLAGLGVARVSF